MASSWRHPLILLASLGGEKCTFGKLGGESTRFLLSHALAVVLESLPCLTSGCSWMRGGIQGGLMFEWLCGICEWGGQELDIPLEQKTKQSSKDLFCEN